MNLWNKVVQVLKDRAYGTIGLEHCVLSNGVRLHNVLRVERYDKHDLYLAIAKQDRTIEIWDAETLEYCGQIQAKTTYALFYDLAVAIEQY